MRVWDGNSNSQQESLTRQEWINKWGYACRSKGGRNVRVHRDNFQDKYGPIPEGLVLDHLCRNRACVNPDHVEPVTYAENAQRGLKAKLNWDQVRAIRALRKAGRTMYSIGKEFGISKQNIRNICTEESWKE